MGAKLMTTSNSDYDLRKPRKTILDRIEDNRTVTGDVLCISCESANMVQEIRPITVSEGVGVKKTIEIDTLHCNLCEYQVIDDKEVEIIREAFK